MGPVLSGSSLPSPPTPPLRLPDQSLYLVPLPDPLRHALPQPKLDPLLLQVLGHLDLRLGKLLPRSDLVHGHAKACLALLGADVALVEARLRKLEQAVVLQ